MKIFPTSAVHDIDAYTIKHEPVASVDLMERAARGMHDWILSHVSRHRRVMVFAGTGNNGGDALALARMMAASGYVVRIFQVLVSSRLSPDCTENVQRIKDFNGVFFSVLHPDDNLPVIDREDVVIEGLFGSGLNRPLQGFAARVVEHINTYAGKVISIDIPSGLFGEDNRQNTGDTIIRATITLTLQFPKLSFFLPENGKYTGNWEVIPIGLHPEAIAAGETPYYYTTREDAVPLIRPRRKFSHKGTYGHALLIAGCYGRMGAAVLASRSCLRTGVGLLTTHVPKYGNNILQMTVPEAMISLDQSDILFSQIPDLRGYSAIGAGPALGCRNNSQKALIALLENAGVPLVLDADAINILSGNPEWLTKLPANTILTPHPKEFDRLAGASATGWERLHKAIEFAHKNKIIVVLKGAHTAVLTPEGTCCFNSTGNPGMATAGSGDVLTGIILSLLAQRYEPLDAAILGVYIHGLAGDIAFTQMSAEAMIASDITNNLGAAFKTLKKDDDTFI
ncbi:MAG: NAD(P)H-hydrate dehydratase [Chlorobi bacterium]|nr:NAD(P)H-hydrate dehydratase [Chlorobiota bacterium]